MTKKENRGGKRISSKPKKIYETTFYKRCSKNQKDLFLKYWDQIKNL